MNISTIQKRIKMIEEYKEEIRKATEILKDQLDNHPEFAEATTKAKEAAAAKKRIKTEVLARKENEKIAWDIKENTEEIKAAQEILAGELIEFYQQNRSDSIEDAEGKKRKFKISVKLSPKNQEG